MHKRHISTETRGIASRATLTVIAALLLMAGSVSFSEPAG